MTERPGYRPAQEGRAVEHSDDAARAHERRKWPLVLTVLAVVVAVAAALLVVRFVWSGNNAGRAWQPPAQILLSSSMRVQPVPGWRASAADLGLPDHSIIGAADVLRRAFVGSLGERGYFLASSSGTPDPQWWLVGLDVRDGRRLFAPVRLSTGTPQPECFLNGPGSLLCLYDDAQTKIAWVIDAQTGSISFTGPTELRLMPSTLTVKQVGIYAVAETEDEGVYGVGPRADTTWFVPGAGSVSSKLVDGVDIAPQTLATQTVASGRYDSKVVFSLADGTVIAPELGGDVRPLGAVVYPGGFALELSSRNDSSSRRTGVGFFDDTGKRLGQIKSSGALALNSPDLPMVADYRGSFAYTVDGQPIAEIPDFHELTGARLIGTRLFVDVTESASFPRWQQYDLLTGEKGNVCEVYMGSRYVGTDGSVGVFSIDNPEAGFVAKGVDLTTCETVWRLPSEVHSLARVFRVNTTLVQLSDDGTELFSLVPPS